MSKRKKLAPEVVSQADLEKALAESGAHLGPPTPEEERAHGKRIDLTETERQELEQFVARLSQKRALFTDQIIIAAAELKLLDDNLGMRIREFAAAHKIPAEGWQWNMAELCFKAK